MAGAVAAADACEREVAVFQRVELGGTRLDAQFVRDHAPAFGPVGLVGLNHRLWGLAAHLAELEDHERIGWFLDGSHDGLDLRQGNAELRADLDLKARQIGLRLHIEVAEKAVEVRPRRSCGEKNEYHNRKAGRLEHGFSYPEQHG